MKRRHIGIALAIASCIASQAQAGVHTFDFEGFTVAVDGGSEWNEIRLDDQWNDTLLDKVNGVPSSGRGAAWGGAVLMLSGPVGAPASASSGFSYTVQAKSGWQFASFVVRGDQAGTYAAGGGAALPLSGASHVAHDGGVQYGTPASMDHSASDGKWRFNVDEFLVGNALQADGRTEFDEYGQVTYSWETFRVGDDHVPLTNIAGDLGLTLGTSDWSSLDRSASTLMFGVSAVRAVSPVPEPESYVMVTAALGLFAWLRRRRAR